MAQISRSALVPFSADQMYQIVNDVNAYPQFLPGCTGSRILESSAAQMVASVDVAKAGISKTFTTRNQLTEGQRIDMQLVDGPFRKFAGGWQFMALSDDACKVELNLDFEFSNMLIELAFGRVFKELANSMVQAFTAERRRCTVPDIQLEVVYALPEKQYLRQLTLPEGSTVQQAIDASGLLTLRPDIDLQHNNKVGIFSRTVKLDEVVKQGDRVEIYRPLLMDPKELRRIRAERSADAKKA